MNSQGCLTFVRHVRPWGDYYLDFAHRLKAGAPRSLWRDGDSQW